MKKFLLFFVVLIGADYILYQILKGDYWSYGYITIHVLWTATFVPVIISTAILIRSKKSLKVGLIDFLLFWLGFLFSTLPVYKLSRQVALQDFSDTLINSKFIIADIDHYYSEKGFFPDALAEINASFKNPRFSPDKFYEKSETHYCLYLVQPYTLSLYEYDSSRGYWEKISD